MKKTMGCLCQTELCTMGAMKDVCDMLQTFSDGDFIRHHVCNKDQGMPFTLRLKRDDFGISVFPMIHAFAIDEEKPVSDRSKRMLSYFTGASKRVISCHLRCNMEFSSINTYSSLGIVCF